MSIQTDSKSLEEPKDPATDNTFKLYELLATKEQTEDLRAKYVAGNFGYGHAKTALLQLILDNYAGERETYNRLMADPAALETVLKIGEQRAAEMANKKLELVRTVLGYR